METKKPLIGLDLCAVSPKLGPEVGGLLASFLRRNQPGWVQKQALLLEGDKASRGHCLKGLAGAELIFVSGVLVWLEGPFLVPNDAYDLTDPELLIPLERITKVPTLLHLWMEQGQEAFSQWLASYQGAPLFLVLESGPGFCPSKIPGRSLFAALWAQAFDGFGPALNNHLLSFSSLAPWLKDSGLPVWLHGDQTLADFSGAVMGQFGEGKLEALGFVQERPLRVQEVLTEIKNWNQYTTDQLSFSVNKNLGPYLSLELGRRATQLRTALGLAVAEMDLGEKELVFTGGRYFYHYLAKDKRQGSLNEELWLELRWAQVPDSLAHILDALELGPERAMFSLCEAIEPRQLIAPLQGKGWKIERELESRVEASLGRRTLVVLPERLEFGGFSLPELIGNLSEELLRLL